MKGLSSARKVETLQVNSIYICDYFSCLNQLEKRCREMSFEKKNKTKYNIDHVVPGILCILLTLFMVSVLMKIVLQVWFYHFQLMFLTHV